MKCNKCNNELGVDAKFCEKCGTPINEENNNDSVSGKEQEHLIDAISGIRHSGIVSITYWTIVFSNSAIYFCSMGSNALPGAFGVISDIYLSQKTKGNKQNLSEMLNKSEKYYQVQTASLSELKYEKGMLGGSIFFPKENGETMKLKLGGKQYKQFINNLATLKK